jgi:hypothetical protein
VGIADLDLLFQIPKKYAHRREERGSKLKRGNNGGGKYAQEHPRTHPNRWGRSPFYSKSK